MDKHRRTDYGSGRRAFTGVCFEDEDALERRNLRVKVFWGGFGKGLGAVVGVIFSLALGYAANVIFKIIPYPPDTAQAASRQYEPKDEDQNRDQTLEFTQSKGGQEQTDDQN